ncbi:MAG TPA: hypothetical protein VGC19_11010 [Rhodanobacter sp.]
MESQVLSEIDLVLRKLDNPLTDDDITNGWSTESQQAARTYFQSLKSALTSNSILPPLGIVRGLDHWGVTGGDLLREIARITNLLRK